MIQLTNWERDFFSKTSCTQGQCQLIFSQLDSSYFPQASSLLKFYSSLLKTVLSCLNSEWTIENNFQSKIVYFSLLLDLPSKVRQVIYWLVAKINKKCTMTSNNFFPLKITSPVAKILAPTKKWLSCAWSYNWLA